MSPIKSTRQATKQVCGEEDIDAAEEGGFLNPLH